MNNYIKGTVREVFYKTDNGFMVGLFKVRYTEHEDMTDYLNKTITFTGIFPELRPDVDYILYGNLVSHPKYGIQYKVDNYEQIMPETKNGVIAFLSSGLFPKIGLKTATKIVETLGDNALDLIIEDYHNLLIVPSLTEKRAKILHDILEREAQSYKTIIYLQNIGFTMNEASKIYNQYKVNTISTVENNIYQTIEDIEGIGFPTVDKVAFNLDIKADDNKRIEACILYVMQDLCLRYGHIYNEIEDIYQGISNYLGIRMEEETFYYYLSSLNKEYKIIIENNKYYLKTYYEAEKNNALRISLLTKKDNNAHPNIEAYIKKLQKKYNIEYNQKQREAIEYSLNNNFLIITGGPGTGKTTIIKAIVGLYKDINKLTDEKLLEDVALLAPTGRAAKRIKEATAFPAMTIHKFLKWNKETDDFGININNKAIAKFVIVDEVSMIDNFLLNNLLNGLSSNVKLVLVGDHHQLPSVGPGQVLKDLIETNILPVIELNDLYRQQKKSYIISLAYEINRGELSSDYLNKQDDYNFFECHRQDIKNIVQELCQKALDKNLSYKDIQVLIPMYKGVNGIDMMNNLLQTIFNPADKSKKELEYQGIIYRERDKVLQVKNNNDLNISNGDIGIIDSILKVDGKDKILIDFDGDIVEYSLKEFDDVTLGYAISIHKSQGSEFDIVIIPMDLSFSRMLYRKLIYTAVTRAKKALFMVGEKEAFIRSVKNGAEEKRKTSLKEFILNNF